MAAHKFTLHEMHNSGNCYKIRLTAALLGIKLDLIEYNTLKGETRTQDYLSDVNANGRIPVLQTGNDTFLPESGAACFYLASGNDAAIKRRKLIHDDRLEHARMLQWMFFEQYSHEPAIAVLRFWRTMVGVDNLSDLQRLQISTKEKQAREVLAVMHGHLEGREWFVGDEVTLADVVLFAYTHCLADTGLELADWRAVEAWVERVKTLDGFVSLQG